MNMKKKALAFLSLALILVCLASCQKNKQISTNEQAPTSTPPQTVVPFSPLPTEDPTPSAPPTPVSPSTSNGDSGEQPTPSVPDVPPSPSTDTSEDQPTPSVPDIPPSPSQGNSGEQPTPSVPDDFVKLTGSGTFKSNTGTSLNISVDWKVETLDDQTYMVTVDVYLDSYSLICSARKSGNVITIGQYELPYSTNAMNFAQGSGKHHTLLSSAEVIYTADTMPEELELGATWKFNGSYSKVQIDIIEATEVIKLEDLK